MLERYLSDPSEDEGIDAVATMTAAEKHPRDVESRLISFLDPN
jgi:hypothetical protein